MTLEVWGAGSVQSFVLEFNFDSYGLDELIKWTAKPQIVHQLHKQQSQSLDFQFLCIKSQVFYGRLGKKLCAQVTSK